MYIVTYPGFALPRRCVLDLMIEFIGPLYNWLQQFANQYLTHWHLLPTGHSSGIISTSQWTVNWKSEVKSKSKLCYDRRSVGQSILVSSTHLALQTRSILLSDSCGFLDVGRFLWLENGSAVYNCCWSSPEQSLLGLSPAGLVAIFYGLRFETPLTWRASSPYLYAPGTGRPSYAPGTGCPFRRLLQLAGLRWRY
jgi:hypothetical protein